MVVVLRYHGQKPPLLLVLLVLTSISWAEAPRIYRSLLSLHHGHGHRLLSSTTTRAFRIIVMGRGLLHLPTPVVLSSSSSWAKLPSPVNARCSCVIIMDRCSPLLSMLGVLSSSHELRSSLCQLSSVFTALWAMAFPLLPMLMRSCVIMGRGPPHGLVFVILKSSWAKVPLFFRIPRPFLRHGQSSSLLLMLDVLSSSSWAKAPLFRY